MPGDRPARRVLMTADAVGGVWTYVLDLASALDARGTEVLLAVMGPPMHDAQRQEAAARGIAVVDAPFRLEWMDDPWEDVDRAGKWLLELAARHEPDVVHLNGFAHAALPWKRPVLVVAHSCVRTWWRGVHGEEAPDAWDTYTARVAEGLARASRVVAPTQALLDEIEAQYGQLASASVVPNGSSAVEHAGETFAKQPFVFAAGRLWDEAKNLAALCSAAPYVSWPVYLAGDLSGPSQCFVPSGGIRHFGRLSPDEIAHWYARAGIYALPARYEPFGLSIVEAAAHGCALVLGDIRTLRENWMGAALFVPPDNRRALAAAVEALATDPDLRNTLAARARARAQRFTVARMVDAYSSLYEELLVSAVAA